MITEVKCYRKKEAFTDPKCQIYLKVIAKEENAERLYSFILFGLCKDGTIEIRDEVIDAPGAEACDLIEQVQLQFIEITKTEFDKAESEYFEREGELNVSWKESSVYRKYYGIDILTNEQKDVMQRVSRFLRRPKETS